MLILATLEMFGLVLSWWAFLHAAVLYPSLAAMLLFGWRPEGIVDSLLRSYYDDLFQHWVFMVGFPIAIWVLLDFLPINRPILPWKKVSDDD